MKFLLIIGIIFINYWKYNDATWRRKYDATWRRKDYDATWRRKYDATWRRKDYDATWRRNNHIKT